MGLRGQRESDVESYLENNVFQGFPISDEGSAYILHDQEEHSSTVLVCSVNIICGCILYFPAVL